QMIRSAELNKNPMQANMLFKPTIKRIGVMFLVSLGSVFSLYAQNLPEAPDHLVTDYTGTLTGAEAQALERKLLAFEDSTSTQIAVAVVRSTDCYDIADYPA